MTAGNIKQSFLIDSGVTLPNENALRIAIEIQAPDTAALKRAPIALVCLPGGAMNRRYFDLQAENDDSYSFAAQMTKRGFLCVLVDHPGVGDSDRPADGYALTADVIAQANAKAIGNVLADLQAGTLIDGLAALPDLVSIIVGHSMGAMFAILQQAAYRQHVAVAVLGFSTRGLPDFVPAEARRLAADPEALRAHLSRLARETFVEPYPVVKTSPQSSAMYAGSNAEAKGVAALKKAMDRMLPVPAFLSMLPGNIAAEARRIDVPVFLGIGERDMVGPPHEVPASFPGSRDVSLHVLPRTGHSHFLFAARSGLFDRLASWASSVLVGR